MALMRSVHLFVNQQICLSRSHQIITPYSFFSLSPEAKVSSFQDFSNDSNKTSRVFV